MAVETKTVEVLLEEPGKDGAESSAAADGEAEAMPGGPVQKFGISLPEDVHAALKRVAEEEGTSVSDVCRRAITEALKDNPDRLRKRIAHNAVTLADEIEAAEKAGHVEETKTICRDLREFSKRIEKGMESKPEKDKTEKGKAEGKAESKGYLSPFPSPKK